jgi:uncharacterized protein YcfJ
MKQVLFAAMLAVSLPTMAQTTRDYAEVVSSHALREEVNQPSERCWVESAERIGAPQERSATGAVVGAIAGGILGNHVGGGTGRALATGVGVLAGAAIGDNVGNRDVEPRRREERRCVREDHWVQQVTGYEVTYRYGGMQRTVVMPRDPGRRIEVEVSVTPVIR